MKQLSFVFALSALLVSGTLRAEDAAKSDVPVDYPLKRCVVSDDVLGEDGKPVKVTYEGTDVYLCCKSCKKDFAKDPAKFVKMVKDAAEAAAAASPAPSVAPSPAVAK